MMDEAAAREIERLQGIVDELEARLEAAERKSARLANLSTADDWKQLAGYYEFEWRQCSAAFNSYAGKMERKLEESERQRKQLSEHIETLARGGIEAATGAGK